MRVATWNVNSILARLPRLVDWLRETKPDAVCLQETKCADDDFPVEPISAAGYDVASYGNSRWNGVALLSRVGLADVRRGLDDEPGYPGVEPRAIAATCGSLRLWSVYVPNGREPGHDHYAYKLAWLAALEATIRADLPSGSRVATPFAVCGDFNVAPTDADVWDPAVFVGATHVTPPERDALTKLRGAGLADVIPRPLKYDRPFTYWDYRAGMFHKNQGMRIDLVYGNPAFVEAVGDAYIDRGARKGKGPSDHAPVVVDLGPEPPPVPAPAGQAGTS
jgi:exodeoxyribonuclease-3